MKGSKTTAGVIAGVLTIILIGGATWLYANRATPDKNDLSRFAVGSLSALATPREREPATPYVFKDASGADTRFADFHGKVVVVNLWAMWCVPCRTEMPTLARLAETYKGTDLLVLPVNVDSSDTGIAQARTFIANHPHLPFYGDRKFQLAFEFPGKGKMPQTILLDRNGKIRATYAGGADWSGPQARALIDALLAEKP